MSERVTHLTGTRSAALVLVFSLVIVGLAYSMERLAQTAALSSTVSVRNFQPIGPTDRRTNITVTFDGDLVAEDSLNTPIDNVPIQFDPPIPGVASWIAPNVLRFFPNDPLLPATSYEAGVSSSMTYANGKTIEEKRKFHFNAPPLTVNDISSFTDAAPGLPGKVRLHASIRLNYPIPISDFLSQAKIRADNNDLEPLSFEVENFSTITDDSSPEAATDSGANYISIVTEPIAVTDQEQQFTLLIPAGLMCTECSMPMAEDYKAGLTVAQRQRLFVNSASSFAESNRTGIRISLSSRVIVEEAKPYISVEPAIPFRIEKRWNDLLLRGNFDPGTTYTLTLKAGMPSDAGAVLERDYSSRIVAKDLPPAVAFTSPGIYLPREGNGLLEVKTVNVDTIVVEVEQIFDNNLVYALAGGYAQSRGYGGRDMKLVGRTFYTVRKGLAYKKNSELSTTVDIGGILGESARGVYKIRARNASRRWNTDSRLVMLTDIGIMARMSDDHLMVWTHSLATTAPIGGATVSLYSLNNQLLLTGRTDSRGIAVFNNLADTLIKFTPYLITVARDNDLSYLRFADALLETSNFDIKGRPYLTSGYEAFVYSDRGVYRPGDTLHLGSIVRGVDGARPGDFPYFLVVYDPNSRVFDKYRLTTGDNGFEMLEILLPDFAPTGRYSVVARIGEEKEIGRAGFQVEEFMPDRIKVTVTTLKQSYTIGERVPINIEGLFLFGPPAAGQNVSGHVTLEAHRFEPSGWNGYSFADNDRTFARQDIDLKDQMLDTSGQWTYAYDIPSGLRPPSALKALLSASVSEQGGRAVAGYNEIAVNPYRRYIGLKLGFDGYTKPGQPFTSRLIALTPDGTRTRVGQAQVQLFKVIYNTVLVRDNNGRYRYKSEKSTELLDSALVAISDSGATVTFTPPEQGSYRLVATDRSGGHAAAVEFWASGWGYAPWAMEEPDRIEIVLDKTTYQKGDNAVAQIRAPFGGKLLLTIEKDRVLESMTIDMADNTAEVTLPVKGDYFPNVYITATVIKKAEDIDPTSPARAFGVAPLVLSKDSRDLEVTLSAPQIMKPRSKFSVEIALGQRGHSQVTVMAVDAGILQLTDYTTPDPLDFFYGQKQPILRLYDIYSLIYPEIEPAQSHLSPGGGRMFEMARRRHLNPISARRVKPVALWSGMVETDASGKATVSFDVPEFNGKLIVMAVAVNDRKFGSATTEVTVRDNIVLQESFPRFVSPADQVEGLVALFNNTGRQATIDISLSIDGPAEIVQGRTQTVDLADGAPGRALFGIRAGVKPGVIKCTITATSGNDWSEVRFELPNRPAMPLVTKYGAGVVTDSLPVAFNIPGGWVPTTDQLVLQTSSLSAVQFHRNIDYLLRYPYGCVEQTTSRLFPLLYFNNLARFVQPELFGGGGADYFVQEGIQKLTTMALPDGTFAYWPGDTKQTYPWATVYASHFMIEARRAGYAIDNDLYDRIVANLRAVARNRDRSKHVLPSRIYAAYVLAEIDQLDRKVANDLKQLSTESLSIESKFLLAGALALSGERDAGFAIIDPLDIQPATFEPETGGNFGSGVRTTAIMLEVLTAIQPNAPAAAVLARSLMENARTGRWYTTQENAYGLMALGKFLGSRPAAEFTGTVEIESDSTYPITEADFTLRRDGLNDRTATVTLDGTGPCYYYWQITGVPSNAPPPEFERGIKITRVYLDADGNPLDLSNVPLGAQVICHITAEAVNDALYNVAISDLLPAGFEIENPRLKTTPRLSWIPKEKGTVSYRDIRDDRLLLFTDLRPKRLLQFYYSLRVVSAGEFVVPPIAAECMYNPMIGGAASSGRLTVVNRAAGN